MFSQESEKDWNVYELGKTFWQLDKFTILCQTAISLWIKKKEITKAFLTFFVTISIVQYKKIYEKEKNISLASSPNLFF